MQAVQAGAHKLTIPFSASETHSLKNVRRTHMQMLEEVRAIVAVARELRLSFHAASRKVIDTDDAELCAWLLQTWNMAVDLVQAVRWQYDLNGVEGKPHANLVAMCQFGEYLCALKKIRVSGNCDEPQLDPRVWTLLGLDKTALVEVLTVVNDEVDNARQFLLLAGAG